VAQSQSYAAILKLSMPMFLANSIYLANQWIDTLMLGSLRGNEETGIYTVAMRIANVLGIILISVNSTTASKISRFYHQGNTSKFHNVIRTNSKIIFYTTTPILLLLCIGRDFLLSIFGAEYIAASFPILFLILGQYFAAISGSVGIILKLTGKHIAYQNIIIVSTIINILLNYLLIPSLGILGAAIATSTSTIALNLIAGVVVKKQYFIYTIYPLELIIKLFGEKH
jgi:O-antigen/teichoic acid export membrane protein